MVKDYWKEVAKDADSAGADSADENPLELVGYTTGWMAMDTMVEVHVQHSMLVHPDVLATVKSFMTTRQTISNE